MRAVSCTAPGDLVVLERDAPRPAADEVLVRIRRVGICGTDMHIFQGKHPFLEYPRVMGHELSGEVVSAPVGSPLSQGERVYINPYIACGTCHACRKGRPNCCMRIGVLGVHRDGGLAEFLALPARNVFSAEAIGLDEAAMVEFLAIGAHGVRRAEIQPGDRVLVVGAGPIGLGAMLFARLAGGEVTTLDLRADRLAFARSALGIPHAVTAGEGAASALADLTGGDFFDVVIDATGNVASIEASFAYVAHCGTYVLLSVVKDVIRFADPEFHKREMKLVASRNALAVDFETVLGAMARGDVPTGLLATHRAPLADLPASMPDWIRPEAGVIKALVEV